ncbi:insulin gene enhancer protein ISL-1-like isoform X3 [Esox lucius]|uniref:insulin gene enhancer protein ISL-1-like isoform X3 n=1 Tax=Esox lucius TaxID=8010 RepID=UPI001476BAAF|nr:insulin gene enhancer protein ISL-1-like isoform X3 [Esox lucius]
MLEEDTVQDHSSAGRSASRCNGDLCPPGAVWPCTGCGEPIRDPEVLRVGTDQQWHIGCLYCDECHCPLGESVSCFLRNGRTLCRTDYGRPGDSFTLGPQGPRCQAEHTTPEQQNREGDTLKQIKGRRGGVWERCEDRLKSRRVRMRTVLSDSQLRALRSCYSQSPRPDALAKLQLSRLTGLNQRVIRVWFQNKRCKDKKSHARRGARPAGGFTVSQALLSARPMVVLSPETPDFALQIYIFKSPWQSHDGHATDRKDHFLTETSQSTCSSEDLHSSQHHSV